MSTGATGRLSGDDGSSAAPGFSTAEHYRLLAENASDVVFRADNNAVIQWISPSVRDLLGWTPDQLIGRPFTAFVHPDDLARFSAARQTVSDGSVADYEMRLRTAAGDYRWISSKTRPLLDEAGVVVGRAGGWRDAEEAVAARKALAASEELFRLAMENAAVGMCLVAPEGRLLRVNSALCDMLGRDETALLAATWQELTHPDDLDVDRALVDDVLSGRIPSYRLRKRYLRPEGTLLWGDLAVSAVRNDAGSVRYLISQVTDVTAQVQAEMALRRREAQLRAVTDSAADAIISADTSGVITEWNRAATIMFGYPREDAVGRPLTLLMPEQYAAGHPAAMERYRAGGVPHIMGRDLELLARHSDGHEFPVEVRLEEWGLDGERFVTATIRDLTERKKAEEALRASEERLANAVEGSGVGLWDWWVQTGQAVFNERWAETCGYALAELEPVTIATWEGMCHPDDLKRSNALLAEHFAGRTPRYECEVRMRHKDGHWVWVLDRGKVTEWGADGRPLRMTGTHLDISDRVRSQEALRESEEFLATTLDALMDPYMVLEAVRDARDAILDFRPVYVNTAACRVMQRDRDQLVGATLLESLPGRPEPAMLRIFVEAFEAGTPLAIDDLAFEDMRLGVTFRSDVRAVRVGSRLALTWRDVSRRHEAEEAIRRRVVELAALQRLSELLVTRVDLATAVDAACGLLTEVFTAQRVAVLLPEEESGQAGFGDAAAPTARSDEATVVSLVEGGAVIETEGRGGERLLAVPLTAHAETLGALLVHRSAAAGPFDAAEQVLARTAADLLAAVIRSEHLHEMETQQAAALERQRIARDLHDAVTQSIHSASFLAEALPAVWERDPDEGRRDLLAIRRLTRAALAELRILLFELRPEALAAAPLNTLLERLGEALAGRGEIEVEVVVAQDLDLPGPVRLAFYRVAQEALNNIGKYAHAAHVEVTFSGDDEARLLVRDDGRGFDPAAVRPESLGLGIMRERAAEIGARVSVESALGAGTTVTMVWRRPT